MSSEKDGFFSTGVDKVGGMGGDIVTSRSHSRIVTRM